ncbi:amino acid transporter [Streptosporangium becharense]|uniref:Amino acid transporter n=1 Tax=Streptosporangium becharense TaxID=1816182 RepID=A0A7W9IMQ8_9ACTN|nr:APC family permease [Streptosporangium becharense]MBB2914581.1 amino acid transporter [Streptosporangium becharense]MBB5823426.1 amino acid transporter [Streptosporangium becharense]
MSDDMTSHAPPPQSSSPALRSGALGQQEVVFQAISHLGPAVGIIIIGPVLAGFVGASTPLIVLLAMVAVLLTGLCVASLARKLPSSGGYYTYVSHGLGERAGFVTAWAYFLYDPLLPTLVLLVTSGILTPVIEANLGVHIPWWLIALVLLAVVFTATYRGVKISARLTLVLGVVESVIMVVFAVAVLIRSGGRSLSLAPLEFPDTSAGLQPVFLAFVFAVLLFTGFESAAPLAEETADPRRAIPRTVLWSTIVVGLIWALVAYAMVVGWGVEKIGGIASADNPFFTLADGVAGWAWLLLAFALLNSALGAALAGQNAGARVMYALGRSGILPRALARIHPAHRTPSTALVLTTLLNVAVCLGLGTWLGPIGGFTFIGLFITLGVIVVYSLGNIAVIGLYWRRHRAEFNPLRHGVVPVAATAILLAGLYYSVWPLPEWPLNLALGIVASWLVIGVIVSALLWRTRRAELMDAARLTFEDAEDTGDEEPARSPAAARVTGPVAGGEVTG